MFFVMEKVSVELILCFLEGIKEIKVDFLIENVEVLIDFEVIGLCVIVDVVEVSGDYKVVIFN